MSKKEIKILEENIEEIFCIYGNGVLKEEMKKMVSTERMNKGNKK